MSKEAKQYLRNIVKIATICLTLAGGLLGGVMLLVPQVAGENQFDPSSIMAFKVMNVKDMGMGTIQIIPKNALHYIVHIQDSVDGDQYFCEDGKTTTAGIITNFTSIKATILANSGISGSYLESIQTNSPPDASNFGKLLSMKGVQGSIKGCAIPSNYDLSHTANGAQQTPCLSSGDEVEIIILSSASASSWNAYFIKFDMRPDAFSDEKKNMRLALGDETYLGATYRELNLGFMKSYLCEHATLSESPSIVNVATIYTAMIRSNYPYVNIAKVNDICLKFNEAFSLEAKKDYVKKMDVAFARSMLKALSPLGMDGLNPGVGHPDGYTYPLLELNSSEEFNNGFYKVYSEEGAARSIYVNTYLSFLAQPKISMPPFAYFYKGIDASYSIDNLREVTKEEGENIAGAALRYLTWGVEYTQSPYQGSPDSAVVGSANNIVSPILEGDGSLSSWLQPKPSLAASPGAGSNYRSRYGTVLGPQYSAISCTRVITPINDKNAILAVVAKRDQNAFNCMSVFPLTSINILWGKNTVSSVSVKNADTELANATSLYDGDINTPLTIKKKVGSEDHRILRVDFKRTCSAQSVLLFVNNPVGIPPAGKGINFNWVRNGNSGAIPNDKVTEYAYGATGSYAKLKIPSKDPLRGVWTSAAYYNGRKAVLFVFSGSVLNNVTALEIENSDTSDISINEIMVFEDKLIDTAKRAFVTSDLGATYKRNYTLAFNSASGSSTLATLSPVSLNLSADSNYSLSYATSDTAASISFSKVIFDTVTNAYSFDIIPWSGSIVPQNLYVNNGNLSALYAKNLVTSPFGQDFGEGDVFIAGNPLSFASLGIDTPRTFNWKLFEQRKARAFKYPNLYSAGTTAAVNTINKDTPTEFDEELYRYYVSENDLYSGYAYMGCITGQQAQATYDNYVDTNPTKPFRPMSGLINNFTNQKRYPDLANPWKFPGVDSIGMFMGAITGAGLTSNPIALFGRTPWARFDSYAKMTPNDLSATDGAPLYYAKSDKVSDTWKNWLAARVTRADIEASTVIIPDVSMIRPGDILVDYDSDGLNKATSDAKNADEVPMHIGIVVATDWATQPSYGAGIKSYWDKIHVVSVSSAYQQVSLGTWMNSNGSFGGFTLKPDHYQIRRILVSDMSSTKAINGDTTPSWDICRKVLPGSDSKIAIDYQRDSYMQQKYPGEENAINWNDRYIPNTGEWLSFQMRVINEGDDFDLGEYQIAFLEKNEQIVNLNVSDRGFGDPLATGVNIDPSNNIYRNRGDGFIIGIKGYQGGDGYTPLYKIGSNALNAEANETLSFEGVPGAPANHLVIHSGKICVRVGSEGSYTYFADIYIRPKSPTNIHPGDDIILSVSYTTVDGDPIKLPTRDSDFFAVYDKKEMWRANLYIDEGAGLDWNDAHPWNAPPASDTPLANFPSWGKNEAGTAWDWGYNEWNREHDGTVAQPSDFIGLHDLPAGNGGQVIKLVPFSKFYKQDVNDTSTATSFSGRVAYSFPGQYYEPGYANQSTTIPRYVKYSDNPTNVTVGDRGNAGSMDSPFDYNKKMVRQWLLRGGNGTPLLPANGWTAYSTANPQGMDISTGLNAFASPPNTKSSLLDNATRAFIPGLGLLYLLDDIDVSFDKPDTRGSWIIEAGTDCIGFASRAVSYGTYGGNQANPYLWQDQNLGWTEQNDGAGMGNIWIQLKTYNGTRAYPQDGNTCDTIFSRTNHDFSAMINDNTYIDQQKKLTNIVPGDIFIESGNTHIAIVSEVLYNANGKVTDVLLIESTYYSYKKCKYDENTTTAYTLKIHKLSEYYTKDDIAEYRILRLRVNP